MPTSPKNIVFNCPSCESRISAPATAAGKSLQCPKCETNVKIPFPSRLARVPASTSDASRMSAMQVTTPFSTYIAMMGSVVGLEKVSEQYVSGESELHGEQRIYGSSDQRGGGMYGSGYLVGSGEVKTEYRYQTRFFLREPSGRDRPISVAGTHLPLLEGHTVTAVYAENDSDESLLLALINHNTGQLHRISTDGALIYHLGIPKKHTIQRLVLSPEERWELFRRKKRAYAKVRPALAVAAILGLIFFLVGLLLSARGFSNALAIIGLIVGLSALGILANFMIELGKIKDAPSHEQELVPNPDLAHELRRLSEFVERIVKMSGN